MSSRLIPQKSWVVGSLVLRWRRGCWSATSVLLLVRTVLGIAPEPESGAITVRRTDLTALDGFTVGECAR